jgi:hypothetical protein
MTGPRIGLIHATPVSIDPVLRQFKTDWPEARPYSLLEDSLAPDREQAGEIDAAMTRRIGDLARYMASAGSEAILFTCSAFGRAIEKVAGELPIPVLKPNEAMFEAAIAKGGRAAMIYTFPPSRAGMEEEFRETAARLNPKATLTSFHARGAIQAARAGDIEGHNRMVADVAANIEDYDSIILAHFSTSTALRDVAAVTSIPAYSSPREAVAKLRLLLERRTGPTGR